MQHFSRVVGTVAHLAKLCTLRMTTDRLFFVLSENLVTGGVAIWCELLAANFFDEYGMEGVNAESNEIYLEFAPDNLVRCLKCAQNAKSIKIKVRKELLFLITVFI